jgi:hypothetical protein
MSTACDPSNLGGGGRRTMNLRPAWTMKQNKTKKLPENNISKQLPNSFSILIETNPEFCNFH